MRKLATDELFARKIIHQMISQDDINREFETIKRLCTAGDHDHLVKVLDMGHLQQCSLHYIDMALCDINLGAYIRSEADEDPATTRLFADIRRGRITYAWEIMKQIADGAMHIHSLGLVHRDIKPDNSTVPVGCQMNNKLKFCFLPSIISGN